MLRWLRNHGWAVLLLAALPLLGGCGGSGSDGPKRIVFLTNGDDPFWDACLQGLKEGERQFDLKAAGLKVERDVPDGAKGQIEKLRQYATQPDIAAVAISAIKADNLAIVEEMRNLKKKGIEVITVDGDVNRDRYRDARSYYIGTENVVGGQVLGKAVGALLRSKGVESGGYVQFAGYTDNDNARKRMNGVNEGIGSGYNEKDRMADEMDKARARDNVRNAITNHPDLVSLIGIWAYNAPAIADVVTETGRRDDFVIGTFDAQALAIDHMEKGNIDVMVVQNPFDMGVQAVRLCKAMIEDDKKTVKEMFPNEGKPGGDIYTTGLRVVVPDAASPVKEDQFDAEVVEYMLLPDFQAWLKKYDLTSS